MSRHLFPAVVVHTALAAQLGTAACSHTTTVSTRPPSAEIYIDGEHAGTGTAVRDLTNDYGSGFDLLAEHPDHPPMRVRVERDQMEWPLIPLAALGTILGGGLLAAGTAALFVVPWSSINDIYVPVTSCLAFGAAIPPLMSLGLLRWLHYGPEEVHLDLDERRVATTPEGRTKILGGARGVEGGVE